MGDSLKEDGFSKSWRWGGPSGLWQNASNSCGWKSGTHLVAQVGMQRTLDQINAHTQHNSRMWWANLRNHRTIRNCMNYNGNDIIIWRLARSKATNRNIWESVHLKQSKDPLASIIWTSNISKITRKPSLTCYGWVNSQQRTTYSEEELTLHPIAYYVHIVCANGWRK